MRISIHALALLMLLTACGSGQGANASPAEEDRASSATSQSQAGPSSEMGGDLLTGRLGSDPIEGGCPYLETDERTRYEVVYPRGWTVDRSTGTLRDPSGAVVGTAGDLVTVRGHVTQDMVSICQMGPIFQATDVLSP